MKKAAFCIYGASSEELINALWVSKKENIQKKGRKTYLKNIMTENFQTLGRYKSVYMMDKCPLQVQIEEFMEALCNRQSKIKE